jgi:hypothetical protein
MAKLTYMPTADDLDEVLVSNITFKAYEPVDVMDPDLAAKLRKNPWFTDGDVDADRHDAWAKMRAAHQKAADLRAEADALVGQGV